MNCAEFCSFFIISFGIILKILSFSVLPSLMDLSTDILNGLEMIGFGRDFGKSFVKDLCTYTEDNIVQRLFHVCQQEEKQVESKAFPLRTTGIISLIIVFLPGIVKAMKMLAKHVREKNYIKIPTVICYVPFPFYIIFVQLLAVCQPNNKDMQKKLIRTLGMEAFYESFPQLVLQTITMIYGYYTDIQLLSVLFSFILLLKTTIWIDKEDEEASKSKSEDDNEREERGLCAGLTETIGYIVWVLPLYLSSIVFKVAVWSLTIAYFRTWAPLPMGILMVELVFLARATGLKDCYSWVYPVLSNFFIINIGGANTSSSDDIKNAMSTEEKTTILRRLEQSYNFAKRSVFVSFVHHTLILVIIILLVFYYDQPEEKLLAKKEHDTISALQDFLVTAFLETKIFWKEMIAVLYPFKNMNSGNVTESCKSEWHKLNRTSDVCWEECTREDIYEINASLDRTIKTYNFVLIMSGVILVGLFNLVLTIYSARDIKVKQKINSMIENQKSDLKAKILNDINSVTDDEKIAQIEVRPKIIYAL